MTWTSAADGALLQGCLHSDADAWDEFTGRFSKLIYWSIRQIMNDSSFGSREDIIADIFQDIFSKLFEKNVLAGVKDAEHLKKFLVVLSTHQTLDRIKSLSRLEGKSISLDSPLTASEEEEVSLQGPVGSAHENEKRAVIGEVMDSLTPKERSCVEFYILDGKSYQEIALIVGFTSDAVSSVISRAKYKIRKKMIKSKFFTDENRPPRRQVE